MGKEISWNAGDCNRTLKAVRPCECGCDFRDGVSGVGYLTGSNSDGDGFTIWIENEQVYKLLETLLESDDTVKQRSKRKKAKE